MFFYFPASRFSFIAAIIGRCVALGVTAAVCNACAVPVLAQQSRFRGHVIEVETGDRVVARLDTWNVTIQLHGIICPTSPETAARRAREYTTRRVLNSDVQVEVRGTGPRETIYGEVRTYDGKSLNAELVGVGLAYWAKSYAPNRNDLALLESEARAGRRGVWGDADASNVVMPEPPPTPAPVPTPSLLQVEPSTAPKFFARSRHRPASRPHITVVSPRRSGAGAPPTTHLQRTAIRAQDRREAAAKSELTTVVWFAAWAAVLAFAAQFAFGGGFVRSRTPFQLGIACAIGLATFLLAQVPVLIITRQFMVSNATFAAITSPPLIAFCAWSSVALCRREQILRAAEAVSLANAKPESIALDLVKVKGLASPMPGREPFVSHVGRIHAVYLKEATYSYDVVQSETYYSLRQRRGRRNTRYAWTPIYQETSMGNFLLTEDDGAAVVDGGQPVYMPLRIARFYNDVPVENWFSRPYPGDTRTQIEFIGVNAPVVVWGRLRRIASLVADVPTIWVGDDAFHNMVVVEGDERRVWSRRPVLGLLLMLAALAIGVLLIYVVSTPGAMDAR